MFLLHSCRISTATRFLWRMTVSLRLRKTQMPLQLKLASVLVRHGLRRQNELSCYQLQILAAPDETGRIFF